MGEDTQPQAGSKGGSAEAVPAGLQSVLRSLKVLEAVAQHQPIRVGELAPMLGMTKASVQRSLQTLGIAGWIAHAGGEVTRWVLSDHARYVLSSSRTDVALRQDALPILRGLRDRTGETVHLSVPAASYAMVIIERAESRQDLRTSVAIGSSYPMIATASGIAVLARHGTGELERATAAAGADVTWSPQEVAAIFRDAELKGYAVQPAPTGDIVAVGAAVLDGQERPIAAIAVLVPRTRFDRIDVERLGQEVVGATVALSHRI